MAEAFYGQIGMFGFNFAPRDWAYCVGSSIQINQNQVLFAILGYSFGGVANQSFKLPDLRGCTTLSGVGTGTAGYTGVYAEKVGSAVNQVTGGNLPAHTHQVNALAAAASPTTVVAPAGNMLAQGFYSAGGVPQRGRNIYGATSVDTVMADSMVTTAGGVGAATVDNRQPFLGLTFAICTYGNWPSRP